MKPILIATKGKGFWGAIWLWIGATRTWEITKDFHYKLHGKDHVIPAGFTFDGVDHWGYGALFIFLSFVVGLLMMIFKSLETQILKEKYNRHKGSTLDG